MMAPIVIGVVDRSGLVTGLAEELASGLENARVVNFGRPVELGPSSPRADVLLLGPGEVTEAGLRREHAWRRANPASATIAMVSKGGPVSRDLQRRGLAVVREPFTLVKAQRALQHVFEGLSLLAREASRWEPEQEHAPGSAEIVGAEPEEVALHVQADDVQVVPLDEPEAGVAAIALAETLVAEEPPAILEAEVVWEGDVEGDVGEDPEPGEPGADAAPARLGHVITVASATGGCGKTFYATNLAAALAEAGHRVVLVDLDLQFGEVAVALRLQHPYSIYDGLYDSKGRSLPEEAFAAQLEELVAHHPLGFDVIVAPKSPELADYVGASDAARVMRAVRPAYDIVIVDTPPSLNEVVLVALDMSDVVAVMATPDVPSLKNLRVFLDTLHRLRIPDQGVRLILNKVEKDIGLDVPQVQEAFAQKFIGLIPQSPVVSRAINAGTVAIRLAAQSPVARRLRESMEQVLPAGMLPAAGAPPDAGRSSGSGWLRAIRWFLRIGLPTPKEVTHEAV